LKVYCKNCKFFIITKSSGMPFGCTLFGFQSKDYPPEKILYASTGKLCDQGIRLPKTQRNKNKEERTPLPQARERDWLA
jgi:hypothetical protein